MTLESDTGPHGYLDTLLTRRTGLIRLLKRETDEDRIKRYEERIKEYEDKIAKTQKRSP
jgi:hypothetical protein